VCCYVGEWRVTGSLLLCGGVEGNWQCVVVWGSGG